ncbi:MAG: glycosyltransferase [Candidatus Methanoperedens sp.]
MKKVSIILIDWNVRESFHAINYLNNQTIPRSDYEIIWVEYYDYRPKPIQDHVALGNIDKWIVLNKKGMYFKHLMYNEGIVASTGEIVVICDSDAIFSPTFIESITTTFNEHKNEDIVLYIEEVRSDNKRFYPFKYIPWEDIWKVIMEAPGLINWDGVAKKPYGLTTTHDIIHYRNYGACFCVARNSIIESGGFDEHPSYYNLLCGPYELGFRFVNKEYKEIWHQSEWILHVWHPWVRHGVDIMGVSDGIGMNATAVEIRKTKRVAPLLENENIRNLRTGNKSDKTKRQNLNIVLDKLIESKTTRFRNYSYNFKFLIKYLLTEVKIKKILLVEEYDPELSLERNIKFTGIVSIVHTFYYDIEYHKVGQQEMSERLIEKCRKFKPDLIIFVPLINTIGLSPTETVEPTKDVIRTIVNKLRIKVYIHNFNFYKDGNEWLDIANYVGIKNSVSDKYADNSKIIHGYPAVNPIDFYDQNIERDIDVSFWGSIPLNSKREEYLTFLRDNGINVCTRLHKVSVKEYANILNRSKISLNICHDDKEDGKIKGRVFEIVACKSLLLDDGKSGTEKFFDVDKDFVRFRNKEDLLEKIKFYLQHKEQRNFKVQSAYDKINDIYNAKNMWGDFIEKMFDDKNGSIYLKTFYLSLEFFEMIIKTTIRKTFPLNFQMFIKSIVNRLHREE